MHRFAAFLLVMATLKCWEFVYRSSSETRKTTVCCYKDRTLCMTQQLLSSSPDTVELLSVKSALVHAVYKQDRKSANQCRVVRWRRVCWPNQLIIFASSSATFTLLLSSNGWICRKRSFFSHHNPFSLALKCFFRSAKCETYSQPQHCRSTRRTIDYNQTPKCRGVPMQKNERYECNHRYKTCRCEDWTIITLFAALL